MRCSLTPVRWSCYVAAMRGLTDKVAVVAGGAGGIGTARRASASAEEGVAVVVGDLDGDAAQRASPPASTTPGAAPSTSPSTSPTRPRSSALIGAALETYGGLDLLHCNAAALGPDIIGRDSDVETVPLDVFDRTIAVNLRGHVLCTRLAIPHLSERGGGAIVYTASAAAFIGEPVRPSYAIAKSGLTALAGTSRRAGARKGSAPTRSHRD